MKRKRCTEPRIVFALQQADGGTPVAEICRKMGAESADSPGRAAAALALGPLRVLGL